MTDLQIDRKRQIVAFVGSFTARYHFPPTIREIGKHIGVNSTYLVAYYLDQLADEGIIERKKGIARGIWVKQ